MPKPVHGRGQGRDSVPQARESAAQRIRNDPANPFHRVPHGRESIGDSLRSVSAEQGSQAADTCIITLERSEQLPDRSFHVLEYNAHAFSKIYDCLRFVSAEDVHEGTKSGVAAVESLGDLTPCGFQIVEQGEHRL